MPASQIATMRNRVCGLIEMPIKELRKEYEEVLHTPVMKSVPRKVLINQILFHEFERVPSRDK